MTLEWSYETIQAFADVELIKWELAEKGWVHVLEDRGTQWVGQCQTDLKRIVSNLHYIDRGLEPECIVDTIRHEIAHALDTGANRYSRLDRYGQRKILFHDKIWRNIAMLVGAKPRARGKLKGYVKPLDTKWTMVFITDDGEIEVIRPVKRFISMTRRVLNNRPTTTANKLWLVLTDSWNQYILGDIKLSALEFWQENPDKHYFAVAKKMEDTNG